MSHTKTIGQLRFTEYCGPEVEGKGSRKRILACIGVHYFTPKGIDLSQKEAIILAKELLKAYDIKFTIHHKGE